MGMPKTGIFGLIDLIGLDLMHLISKSLLSNLPADDPYRAAALAHPLIDKMIADGYTGRKGKGGFYRVKKNESGKVFETIDLKTGEPRATEKPKLKSLQSAGDNLCALCEAQDKIGISAWTVLSQSLAYAASVAGQIAADIAAIDAAMRHGYNWEYGPFELIDKIGANKFVERLKVENRSVPELLRLAAENGSFYRVEDGKLYYLTFAGEYTPLSRPEGVLLLADVKRAAKAALENDVASVWDIGDGVLCFEFHTKMNTIDERTLSLLMDTIALIEANPVKYKGLVIYNEANVFSAGANLGKALEAAKASKFQVLRFALRKGQKTFQALRFASFPTVSAPAGVAVGGACEITLHCAAAQAHAETYIGLVEVRIGVVPGWGGCTQMLGRAFAKFGSDDPLAPIRRVFETISHARMSTSAASARDLLFLRETDGITMNRDRLLFDAKQRVLQISKNYARPEPLKLKLPGSEGYAALESVIEGWRASGKALPHDVTVFESLAAVLCGGKDNPAQFVTEGELLWFEHREFMKLEQTPETYARVEYMLKTGKPLRN
jgi:3-hydroxyacyl-CoA dehydrogenase